MMDGCVGSGGANETSTLLEQTFDHIIYTGGGRLAVLSFSCVRVVVF